MEADNKRTTVERMLLMRSVLFVPGSRPRMIENALRSPADVVILDLEDGVAPGEKDLARRHVVQAIENGLPGHPKVFVRVNAMSTDLFPLDLEAAVRPGPLGICVPKCENSEDLAEFERFIAEEEVRKGIAPGSLQLMPFIESAKSLLHCAEIAAGSAHAAALAFGAEDYLADLEVPRTDEGRELNYPRSVLAVAARAAGVHAIDGIYTAIHDEEGLRRDCANARRIGMTGKQALHPAQLAPINETFSPAVSEVMEATKIVEAFEKATGEGSGVVMVDGRFVDRPVVIRAQRLLEKARMLLDRHRQEA